MSWVCVCVFTHAAKRWKCSLLLLLFGTLNVLCTERIARVYTVDPFLWPKGANTADPLPKKRVFRTISLFFCLLFSLGKICRGNMCHAIVMCVKWLLIESQIWWEKNMENLIGFQALSINLYLVHSCIHFSFFCGNFINLRLFSFSTARNFYFYRL